MPWRHRRAIGGRPALGAGWTPEDVFYAAGVPVLVASIAIVSLLAAEKSLIIDESDGDLSSFPTACALGYAGVTSNICKGFYKSILNSARVVRLNADLQSPRYFLSAEDLNAWAGVSVQQDLALVALLGLKHVERNGHHFINGMSFAPGAEQSEFVARHPQNSMIGSPEGPHVCRFGTGNCRWAR